MTIPVCAAGKRAAPLLDTGDNLKVVHRAATPCHLCTHGVKHIHAFTSFYLNYCDSLITGSVPGGPEMQLPDMNKLKSSHDNNSNTSPLSHSQIKNKVWGSIDHLELFMVKYFMVTSDLLQPWGPQTRGNRGCSYLTLEIPPTGSKICEVCGRSVDIFLNLLLYDVAVKSNPIKSLLHKSN